MGYEKHKRPILDRAPGSAGTSAGVSDSARLNTLRVDNYRYLTINAASSSNLATIGPRGFWTIAGDSSAGSTCAPKVVYLATPSSGDVIEVTVLSNAATSNGISLRTSTSAVFIGSTDTTDSLLFIGPGSARLVALSSARWLVMSALSSASGGSTGAPALLASSS